MADTDILARAEEIKTAAGMCGSGVCRVACYAYGIKAGPCAEKVMCDAAALIDAQAARIKELEQFPVNVDPKPLTLNQIRAMRGEPVYCPEIGAWGVITMDLIGHYQNRPFLRGYWLPRKDEPCGCEFTYDIIERNLVLYRMKPPRAAEDDVVKPLAWISVEERLPDGVEAVLIRCDDGNCHVALYFCDRWSYYRGDKISGTITHWMPLPEPPKEGTQ